MRLGAGGRGIVAACAAGVLALDIAAAVAVAARAPHKHRAPVLAAGHAPVTDPDDKQRLPSKAEAAGPALPAPVAPVADEPAVVPAPPSAPAPEVVAPAPPAPAPAEAAAPTRMTEAQVISAKDRLPDGKGMWLRNFDYSEGGDAAAIVQRAKAAGVSHVYVRLGDSKSGFYAGHYLDRILPVAHASGVEIIGWDFPYLLDATGDATRAAGEIAYVTPTGDR
ncbi:MAG: hypothetical protein QOG64_2012, partial [Acidimicrobiaceae bacterium]|nr:hypothetical protein [Acidimicrobiaceae bacterium]